MRRAAAILRAWMVLTWRRWTTTPCWQQAQQAQHSSSGGEPAGQGQGQIRRRRRGTARRMGWGAAARRSCPER